MLFAINFIHSEDGVGLHFFATNCQGEVLAGLFGRRESADLLQPAQIVFV